MTRVRTWAWVSLGGGECGRTPHPWRLLIDKRPTSIRMPHMPLGQSARAPLVRTRGDGPTDLTHAARQPRFASGGEPFPNHPSPSGRGAMQVLPKHSCAANMPGSGLAAARMAAGASLVTLVQSYGTAHCARAGGSSLILSRSSVSHRLATVEHVLESL